MPAAMILMDEELRLEALRSLNVLDTPPDLAFDRLALKASHIAGSPAALISFVDADRQWFKARVGLNVDQTHRDMSFCAHAIQDDEVLWVEDASRDPRFADNPLVTGSMQLRFYAGSPIRLSTDVKVGTICVLDSRPRPHDPQVSAALRAIAGRVSERLEQRAA